MNRNLSLNSTHKDLHSIQMSKSSPFFSRPRGSQSNSPMKNERIQMSKSYTPKLSKILNNDMSYLISNNSKQISEVVSYVPVIDRLTCSYLMPEANEVLRRSKSLTMFNKNKKSNRNTKQKPILFPNDENVSDSVRELNFSSSMLSDILPNTLSYIDLTRYMQSPQYKMRLRGQTPSFEKILAQLKHDSTKARSGPIDLTDFFKRDEELTAMKERIGNPPPPKFERSSSERTLKIAINAQKKRSRIAEIAARQKAEAEAEAKREKVRPHTRSTYVYPKFRLAINSELSTNVKNVRQKIAEFEKQEEKNKMETSEVKMNTLSPRNMKLAKEAKAKRDTGKGFRQPVTLEVDEVKLTKFGHEPPKYISEVTGFLRRQKSYNRTLK